MCILLCPAAADSSQGSPRVLILLGAPISSECPVPLKPSRAWLRNPHKYARPRGAGCILAGCAPPLTFVGYREMLVRKEPETAPLCPQCGDAMRLARKLPPVRPLSGLVVHLCGRCGHVGPASASQRHRRGFDRNGAHDIPYFAPPRASANEGPSADL